MSNPFSEEEKALLAPYVTSTEATVFVPKNLGGIVGAAYARYGRAKGGFRETLLKEFVKEGVIDPTHAQALIERVLIAFGDDSVGELEGSHLSIEEVSVLATKEFEDRRIGGSPIEQSTRYVFYDERGADGNYRYYRDPAIMASAYAEEYVRTMDEIFATYCGLVDPMTAYYEKLKPIETAEYDIDGDGKKETYASLQDESMKKAFRITYKADIRTKACDTLRALLPVATRTNVGFFGNGRFLQHALTHGYSSAFGEARAVAAKAHDALNQTIPTYVKRAQRNAYLVETREKMQALADRLFAGIAPETSNDIVHLLDRGEDAIVARAGDAESLRAAMTDEEDNLVLALMLFPHLQHPLGQIRNRIRTLSDADRRELRDTYLGNRQTRRDRPGRALEGGYPYTFDLCTDFGSYKDLMRHRMMSTLRQRFTPTLGFAMPDDLVAAGFAGRAQQCVDLAVALYERLLPDFPEEASYATLHGSLVRWSVGINDRALMHLVELRTTPQGHPLYRKVGQLMHKAVATRYPWRAEAMKFADHGDYFWARGDAEARQRAKEAAFERAQQAKQTA